jgi:uncharacterized repeat protein (TIGR03803 family)
VGGTSGNGVVYKIDASGNETVIHSFTGPDGANPSAGLIRDSSANLYGTTASGGASGDGVIFEVDPSGNKTVLHSFTGPDGARPSGSVIRDAAGNLYGTTSSGGTDGVSGVVFKLDPRGNLTVLHNFSNVDGAQSTRGLIRDSAGNLYGTTNSGGAAGLGVMFKLDSSDRESVLYSFPGSARGTFPSSPLIRDAAGNFYGSTGGGGLSNVGGVFRLDKGGH